MTLFNDAENSIIDLVFLNTGYDNIGDATGLPAAATVGSLYVHLHTGDPGESGDSTTLEADYTSYAAVAVARNGSNWTRTGNVISNDNEILFPEKTGGADDLVTYASISGDAAGTASPIVSGALSASLNVTDGVAPRFAAGTLTFTLE